MYVAPQTGQAAADTAAPTCNAHYLGTLRRNILAAIINNPDFTAAEQLRCNDAVYQCQDSARLALWLKNVRRVVGEREQALSLARFTPSIKQGETLVVTAPLPAAQRAYQKAAARSRRLTVRRNELFEQLNPMRPDGFPVYSYAENPNRAQLDAAHAEVMAANQQALALLDKVKELEAQQASTGQAVPRAATPAQCDELYRLACHPALTPTDKAQVLVLLPSFTEGEAVTYIGKLYTKVLRHTGQGSWRATSTLAQA